MKTLNIIAKIKLIWWSLINDIRLLEYEHLVARGLPKARAYMQSVAFAPPAFNRLAIRTGNYVFYAGDMVEVAATSLGSCKVLIDEFETTEVKWKEIRPIELTEKMLFQLDFGCTASVWTIGTIDYFVRLMAGSPKDERNGWHRFSKISSDVERLDYVHQLQNDFFRQTGNQLQVIGWN